MDERDTGPWSRWHQVWNAGSPGIPISSAARLLSRRPSTLTDADLCRAWRHTFALLRGAGSAEEWSSLDALRRAYLDELEQRNPEALQAWFASGARTASGPERFVAPLRFLPPV